MPDALKPIEVAPVPRIAMRRAEAAEALGVSDRTLWQWTKDGLVPHLRIGSTVLYSPAALSAWIMEATTVELLKIDGAARNGDES